MFTAKKNIYLKMPVSLQRFLTRLPYSFYIGTDYYKKTKLNTMLEFASNEELRKFQAVQLERILKFSTSQVPAYKKYKYVVDHYHPFDALKEFPLISREIIKKKFSEYIPDCIKRISHHRIFTGGSSGNQIMLNEDDNAYAREMAFIHDQWKRVGYRIGAKKATLRVVNFRITPSRLWKENPVNNEIQFSPFHMNDSTLSLYFERLLEFKPEFIHGYPSSVNVFAEYISRNSLSRKLPLIKAALLGSEPCSRIQRKTIEKAFRTKVYTWYGHSERVILGGECEKSRIFHHPPAYGYLEILNEKNEECRNGESGELIGTGFWNYSMPLIRYRTDDFAVRREPSCACKRNWDRFSHVQGRRSVEAILTKKGSMLFETALVVYGDVFSKVIRYQYYQNKIGEMEIRIIPSAGFSANDANAIIDAHKCILLNEIDIEIKIVNDIPLTINGKQRRIISELDI